MRVGFYSWARVGYGSRVQPFFMEFVESLGGPLNVLIDVLGRKGIV